MDEYKENVIISRRFKELGVYYLYFLCVFMDKLLEKISDIKIDTHDEINFKDKLDSDFIKTCESIEIISANQIYEIETCKTIKVNFCLRFIHFINEQALDINANPSKLRAFIFEDLVYLSYFYYGVKLDIRDINVEPVYDYLIKKIVNVLYSKPTDSLFNVKTQLLKLDGPSVAFLNVAKDDKKEENDELAIYESYLKIVNDNAIKLNNKIGFRLAKDIALPQINELVDARSKYILEYTDCADSFIASYFFKTQSCYLLEKFNNVLRISNIGDVNTFLKNKEILSDLEMEELIKNA